MNADPGDPLRVAQAEVERRFGRCVLRLQGYERIAKAVLAAHRGFVPLDPAAPDAAARVGRFDQQTLGALVGQMTGSFLGSAEARLQDDAPEPPLGMRWHFQIGLSVQDLAQVATDLRNLVALRNWLVHHFTEDHDLFSVEGCARASAALDEAGARIDRARAELQVWAGDLERMRSVVAEVQSQPDFVDVITGRKIPWPITVIVQALREAEQALAQEGWTPLRAAVTWIATRYPDEKPDGYGCWSWPHVVQESRLFDLRIQQGDGARAHWYRSKAGGAAEP